MTSQTKNVSIDTETFQNSFVIARAGRLGTLAFFAYITRYALAAFWIMSKVADQPVGTSRYGKLVVIPSCFTIIFKTYLPVCRSTWWLPVKNVILNNFHERLWNIRRAQDLHHEHAAIMKVGYLSRRVVTNNILVQKFLHGQTSVACIIRGHSSWLISGIPTWT